MRKIILIITIISSFIIANDKTTITPNCICAIYLEPSGKSEIVNYANTNKSYDVLDTVCDYVQVVAIQGTSKKNTTDNVGITGWVWAKLYKDGFIVGEGVNVRSEPKKGNNIICTFKKGSTVKLLKKHVIWYKTLPGYFFYKRVK
jgi:hypothetical protein